MTWLHDLNSWLEQYGQNIALFIVVITAPGATLYPLLLAWTPWSRSWVGRALMTSGVALALLIDLSLLYVVFGESYPFRQLVRIAVYALICLGVYFKIIAFVLARRKAKRERRESALG